MELLIVGGGHASVALFERARAWQQRGVSVTLLSDHPYLYYSGMVPEYLGGVYSSDEVRIDLKGWCQQTGVTWHQGRAVRMDPTARTVTTAYGSTISYDVAVIDIGASNPPPPPGAKEALVSTKPMHKIERLEAWLRTLPERTSPQHLVVAGGGAAGTELGLNIQARIQRTAPRQCTVSVVEPADRLIPSFPEGASQQVANLFAEAGGRLYTGRRVQHRTPTHAVLNDGTRLPCTQLVWATGSVGSPFWQRTPFSCTDSGFVKVIDSLQIPSAPRVFAAGDCAAVGGYTDLPRIGVHAVKQGPLLADNVDRMLQHLQDGKPPERAYQSAGLRAFKPYSVAPLILSTGTASGLWRAGSIWWMRPAALRMKHLVDLRWMNRYRLPDENTWPAWQAAHARCAQDSAR
ncbi:MAG: FAD-dependent oxidoreductase [Longimonas sp.]|uniref:NAD(P)/FAD-dependent oxidoreductase n=1 Tax=Longimonas sp. TaxID=2039626 RepID=UPI00334DF57C